LLRKKQDGEIPPPSDSHNERVPSGNGHPFQQKAKSVLEEKKLLLRYLQLLRQNCIILNVCLLFKISQ